MKKKNIKLIARLNETIEGQHREIILLRSQLFNKLVGKEVSSTPHIKPAECGCTTLTGGRSR